MWHAAKALFIVGTASFLVFIFLLGTQKSTKIIRPVCDVRNHQSLAREVIASIGNPHDIVKLEIIDGKNQVFTVKQPFNATRLQAKNRVIILSIARGHESWGNQRSFQSYLEMIEKFEYPKELISFGLLISDKEEYELMKKTIETTMQVSSYGSFKLILRIDDEYSSTDRTQRHRDDFQKQRRRTLARLRNYLLSGSLEDNDAVLWIDADIVSIPPNLLSQMISSGKDIIVPQCQTPTNQYFDWNTWKGPRKKPDRRILESGATFIPGPTEKTTFLYNYDQDFVEIDSVGGTVLFVRGDVHREGVIFPTQYIVGGDWEYEGYDAIETEGICYLAQHLCYKCWGMPKAIVIHDNS
jgi:hypothetical protein